MARLSVDTEKVARCRALAAGIAGDVQSTIDAHTSVGLERTVARAYGVEGADGDGTPLANALVDRLHKHGFVGFGVAYFLGRALSKGAASVQEAAEQLAFGGEIAAPSPADDVTEIRTALRAPTDRALARIDEAKAQRSGLRSARNRARAAE